MTTNDNHEQSDEAVAREREAASIRRDDDAIQRDDAAKVRDVASKRRDSAAATRHQEIRKDIENTQNLVSDTGEDVIFRVDGLQDKFFEHLIFATNAIEDATEALEAEKRTRKIQIGALAAAVVLGIVLGIVTLMNTIHIEQQAERSDQVACLAINEGRETIYNVLENFFERSGGTSEEEEIVLEELRANDLIPLDCENGIDFMDENL